MLLKGFDPARKISNGQRRSLTVGYMWEKGKKWNI